MVQKGCQRTPYAGPRAFGKRPTAAQAASETNVNVFLYECGALKSDLVEKELKNQTTCSKNRAVQVYALMACSAKGD